MIWPDPAPAAPVRAASCRRAGWVMLACALPLCGCHRGRPEGFFLRPLVAAGQFTLPEAGAAGADAGGGSGGPAGLSFPSRPALADLEIDHERRPVVLTAAAPWSWTGRVPPRAALHAGLQLVPAAWRRVRRLQAVVVLRDGRDREVLQVVRSAERVNPAWLDLSADLGRYAGRQVTLDFSVALGGLPPGLRGGNLVAWGPVAVTGAGGVAERGGRPRPAAESASPSAPAASAPAPAAAAGPPPNVIVILVDTLRRDRLTPYGYRRETSPEIGRRLAAAGTVVEEAYSQAPWTLPSMVSLMTGRYPGELLGADLSAYGIPAGITPIAERLAHAGYETAGFLANPTMHVGSGFERGFDTFYAPPADIEWLRRHADDLNRHVLPWLAAYQDQDRPFFLYLHYIDPHDPYENPETAGNRSPFEGEYRGPVAGDWVHGIYTGKLVLPDPARDLAHLSALYDSEVHYVDHAIGQVLAALRPEVLAHTLVLLTADHGEELLDHGGWKHGQTLYEEQIHVPLIVRWDGHVAAGRRLAGTVRLLDVAPTLAAAAGAAPDPGWAGLNLLPALTGAAPLAERPAFAEGLSSGPLRTAAVLGRWKLMAFNRAEPFVPADELQDHLWREDLARLARIELYDLARDPGERHNLAAEPGAAGAASGGGGFPRMAAERWPLLATVIERRLDQTRPGLRLLASGVPAGSRLRLDLTLARPPRRWQPYLLSPADRVTLDGSRLVVELAGGDPLPRGVRIEEIPGEARGPAAGGVSGAGAVSGAGGAFGAGAVFGTGGVTVAGAGNVVQSLTASLDGVPLPPARVRAGAGTTYAGGPLPLAALRTRQWPGALPAADGPVVRIWVHDTAGEPPRRVEHDAETERSLRALGYIE
ncbi:MAG TPA: sulfatase-like hydrolase/transferase [Thermoanaerobaculia bacterium]|nr:sulfatase-like hydrolase/transferase [Thermoanaerobaculia bacterium]